MPGPPFNDPEAQHFYANSAGTLAEAITFCSTYASASKPCVIQIDPGAISLTSSVALPSYTSLVGLGRESTIIKRSVAAANSDSTNTYDPIINADNTVDAHIQDLTILRDTDPGDTQHNPACISANNATYFGANRVTFLMNTTTTATDDSGAIVILNTTTPTAQTEANTYIFEDCMIQGNGIQAIELSKASANFYNCQFIGIPTSLTISHSTVTIQGGIYRFIGCDLRLYLTSTIAGVTNVMGLGINSPASALVYVLGSHVLYDLSAGTPNSSIKDYCAIFVSPSATVDSVLRISASTIDYYTGVVDTSALGNGVARSLGGIIINNANSAATGTTGQVFADGLVVRDLGGSGTTPRNDFAVQVGQAGGLKEPKQLKVKDCAFSTWSYVNTAGAPTPTHAHFVTSEQTPTYQSGTATFVSAATVAVTLGIAYPTKGTNVTDYIVRIEPAANETFWVTAKTNTGFTLNSSNAASTATVNWVVTR